jgi:hypothetical protein
MQTDAAYANLFDSLVTPIVHPSATPVITDVTGTPLYEASWDRKPLSPTETNKFTFRFTRDADANLLHLLKWAMMQHGPLQRAEIKEVYRSPSHANVYAVVYDLPFETDAAGRFTYAPMVWKAIAKWTSKPATYIEAWHSGSPVVRLDMNNMKSAYLMSDIKSRIWQYAKNTNLDAVIKGYVQSSYVEGPVCAPFGTYAGVLRGVDFITISEDGRVSTMQFVR